MGKETRSSLQWVEELDSILNDILEIYNGKNVITYPEQVKIFEELSVVIQEMNENRLFQEVPSLFSGAQAKVNSVISITSDLIEEAAKVN